MVLNYTNTTGAVFCLYENLVVARGAKVTTPLSGKRGDSL